MSNRCHIRYLAHDASGQRRSWTTDFEAWVRDCALLAEGLEVDGRTLRAMCEEKAKNVRYLADADGLEIVNLDSPADGYVTCQMLDVEVRLQAARP